MMYEELVVIYRFYVLSASTYDVWGISGYL